MAQAGLDVSNVMGKVGLDNNGLSWGLQIFPTYFYARSRGSEGLGQWLPRRSRNVVEVSTSLTAITQ